MSAPVWKWLQHRNDRWHAWALGARSTACGRINLEHLRAHPAKSIVRSPSVDGLWCAACAKKAQMFRSVERDVTVSRWLAHLRLDLTRSHIRVAEKTLVSLAGFLARLGPPDEAAAVQVWNDARPVLFAVSYTKRAARTVATVPHLAEVLKYLDVSGQGVARIAEGVRTWREVTGRAIGTDRFHAVRVVQVMHQVPAVRPYLEHLKKRGLVHFAAVFHPNTLERARKDASLRGTFSGANTYWDNTTQDLHIVLD